MKWGKGVELACAKRPGSSGLLIGLEPLSALTSWPDAKNTAKASETLVVMQPLEWRNVDPQTTTSFLLSLATCAGVKCEWVTNSCGKSLVHFISWITYLTEAAVAGQMWHAGYRGTCVTEYVTRVVMGAHTLCVFPAKLQVSLDHATHWFSICGSWSPFSRILYDNSGVSNYDSDTDSKGADCLELTYFHPSNLKWHG